ncbi:MAG: transglycosylase domain-containing protein, partial [Acidobacteriota bacterium]
MNRYARIIRRIRVAFYAALGLLGLVVLAAIASFFIMLKELPRVPDPLSRIIERPSTELYAATGERVLVLGGRESVPLSRVSPQLIEAVVATEDHRFWSHHGVDKFRLIKAFIDG